jgi:hypothetical protein
LHTVIAASYLLLQSAGQEAGGEAVGTQAVTKTINPRSAGIFTRHLPGMWRYKSPESVFGASDRVP